MKIETRLINELLPLARDAMGIANLITAAAQFLNGGVEDVDGYIFDRIRDAREHVVNLLDALQYVLKEYGGDEE